MTTPRPIARMRRSLVGLAIASLGLLAIAGCDPRALIFFLQPFDPTIPPAFTGLKGKKVVILTHAASSLSSDYLAVDHEITRELASVLRDKVKRIDLVEPKEVWNWVEAHPSWTEAAEAARAFKADMVIFLEIDGFKIQDPSSPGLFKGESHVHIQVTEMKVPKNGKDKTPEPEIVYDGQCDSEFPKRGPMDQAPGVSAAGFRNKFIKVVATEVSWHFVDRAYGDDIQDAKIY